MTPELAEAVRNAYREFARYRLRGVIEVCKCRVCVGDDDERALCSVPLRALPSRLLAEYTNSAHGFTDRTADELRYFLPRYFELIADGDPPTTTGLELCLSRLHAARYRVEWPASERAAVDAFFAALLVSRLREAPEIDPTGLPAFDRDAVEAVLCMAVHAGGDLAALLSIIDDEHGRAATLHIANIIAKVDWRKKRLDNSGWYGMSLRPDAEAAMRDVMAWLLRPAIRERLERACLAEPDDAAAGLLSHAEGLVKAMIEKAFDQSPQ